MLNSCQALTRLQPPEQLFLSINGDSWGCNTQEWHCKQMPLLADEEMPAKMCQVQLEAKQDGHSHHSMAQPFAEVGNEGTGGVCWKLLCCQGQGTAALLNSKGSTGLPPRTIGK